jgi:MHS family alpha-ketoglutarate permease-like MFS transporter
MDPAVVTAGAGIGAQQRISAIDTNARFRAILIGSAGNLVEWYDVYVFATFQFYFAGSFFTDVAPDRQQLYASIVFALGFVSRPFGSIIIGRMADRIGRPKALLLSILLMGVGSLIIALTPSAGLIGSVAPVLLLLARLLQGLGQGGEYGTSCTYLSEMSRPDRRGFYSGIWMTTNLGGQLLAVLTLLVLQLFVLDAGQLKQWGWRIPFMFGALLSFGFLLMRRTLRETEHFDTAKRAEIATGSWRELLRHWKALLLVVGFTAGGISAFYTYTTYMQQFLKHSVKLPEHETTLVTLGALLVAVLLQPILGRLSDSIGRKPLLLAFGFLGTLFTYPLLDTLHHTSSPLMAFMLIVVGWVIVSGYTSVTAVVKTELFPTAVRAMGVGIPYAITAAVFGGTVDGVAQYFRTELHYEQGFYWYATALIFGSFLVYIFMPDTRRHSKIERLD